MESALENIEIDELIKDLIADDRIELRTALPCIAAADQDGQTVELTPAIFDVVPDGATPPNYVAQPVGQLADVPIAFFATSVFGISAPVKKGDTGYAIFSARPTGAFRSTGDAGDPGDVGMHTLDGAMFLPCRLVDGKLLQSASSTNMVIGADGATESQIEIKPTGGGNLGAGATKAIARDGDSISLGACSISTAVVSGSTVVTGVTINGVALSIVPSDPGGKINSGSPHWNAN